MIDISNIKPGDKVTVELIVGEDSDYPGRIVVRTEDMLGFWQMPVKCVRSHIPASREVGDKALEAGDRMMYAATPIYGWLVDIVAVVGDKAWVRSAKGFGKGMVVDLADLRHYQEPAS